MPSKQSTEAIAAEIATLEAEQTDLAQRLATQKKALRQQKRLEHETRLRQVGALLEQVWGTSVMDLSDDHIRARLRQLGSVV